jgi:hypothetical protein
MLFVYVLMQIYCITRLSLTYDEPLFAAYGMTILKFQAKKDIQQFDTKLPATALNMLPRAAQQVFNPELKKSGEEADKDVVNGRYISLLATILLGLIVYRWSAELYNNKVAVFSLLLFLLCPDILAHGIFVSTDMYAALFLTATFYFLWKYRQSNHIRYFILSSLSVALAQISKFSMVHLFILFPLLLLFTRNTTTENSLKKTKPIYLFFLFTGINWLIISISHFFYQEFMMLDHYEFKSKIFRSLQSVFGKNAAYIPVPLPSSYISSMDLVMYVDKLGGGEPGSLNAAPYVLGETSRYGFWYYYFVVLFYKLPISTLLIWLASLIYFILKFNRTRLIKHDIFLLLAAFYYFIYLNFFYTTQIGARHIIIIYPLLFIFSGNIIKSIFEKRKQAFLILLLGWQAISVLLYFPHFLPYTNEFIINKKNAYKKIGDSNLCYGEGKKFLSAYLEKHKDVSVAPDSPQAGKFVVEVNEYLDLTQVPSAKYKWMQGLKPIDHIHSEYLVFDISPSIADSLQKKRYK